MPGLNVVSQPNNVQPALTVAPPQPTQALHVAAPTPQPALHAAPLPQTAAPLPVAQPQTQPSVAVQIPPLVLGVQTAINRGADAETILKDIAAKKPEFSQEITQKLGAGQDATTVLQDIVQNASGLGPDNQDNHTTWLSSLWDALGKPLAHAAATPSIRVAQAIGKVISPDKDVSIPDNPLIGSFNDPGAGDSRALDFSSGGDGVKNIRQAAGEEGKFVSLGVGSPAAAGALYGFSDANEKNRGILGTLAETAGGAAGGKLSDAALVGASHYISGLGDSGASIVNSLIKPLDKQFRFGKNPGAGIANEGIIANNLKDLYTKVTNKLGEVGDLIGQHLSQPHLATVTSDFTPVIDVFDQAITDAAKGGPNNQALVTRLVNARDALTKDFAVIDGKVVPSTGVNEATGAPVTKDFTALNPLQGNTLKQDIGSHRSWNGTPSEDNAFNQAVTKAYHVASDLVEHDAPGVKALNGRYGNLLSAQTAVERRVNQAQANNLTSPFEKLGIGAALVSLLHGDIPGAATEASLAIANHTLGSAGFKTRAAATFSKIKTPQVVTDTLENNPAIKNTLNTGAKGLGQGARYVGNRLGARIATGSQ